MRKLALPLSFTSLLTIVLLAMAAISGAYVWGVMSGRASVQEAKTALPAQETRLPAPEADPAILKARELEFAHALKGESRPPIPEKQPESEKPAVAPENPVAQSVAKEPGAETEKKSVSETEKADTGEAPPAPAQLFDYTFQMAALKDEQAVDNLRERLEGRGMRTRMERSGKIYLVLVLLRGDEKRAAEVAQAARELRLGEPLLRGKKPAER